MKRNIVLDSCRTDIDSLVADALNHLKSLGYSPKTLTHYRNWEDYTPYLTIKMK